MISVDIPGGVHILGAGPVLFKSREPVLMLVDGVLHVDAPLRLLRRFGPVRAAVGADTVGAVAATGTVKAASPEGDAGRPEGEVPAVFLAGGSKADERHGDTGPSGVPNSKIIFQCYNFHVRF